MNNGQLDIDLKFILQLFNTPGDEITPRSDIVGKYFKNFLLGHGLLRYGRIFNEAFCEGNKLVSIKNGAVHGD